MGFPLGRFTVAYSALDYVELVKIRHEHFRELCHRNKGLLERIEEISMELLGRMRTNLEPLAVPQATHLADYLEDGLFKGQSLLVLDLERCTRCDGCTRACSDSHGGVTRLIREGERYGRFLVATSCRSCINPTCMLGCPVDAIHRTTLRHAVLTDLGLAQLADEVAGKLTRTRQFVGTLRYASPEQVLAVGGVDCRSDVHSLGVTLWELLTLRLLYGADE